MSNNKFTLVFFGWFLVQTMAVSWSLMLGASPGIFAFFGIAVLFWAFTLRIQGQTMWKLWSIRNA